MNFMLHLSNLSESYPFFCTLSSQGKTLEYYTTHRQSLHFLEDIFYPNGVLNASISFDRSKSSNADFRMYEKVLDSKTFSELHAWLKNNSNISQHKPSANEPKPAYLVNGYQFLDFSDTEAAESFVVRDGKNIFLLSDVSSRYIRKPTRLAREILARWHEANDFVGFHASAFELDNKAFLVIGDSGAGKSTLSLALPRFDARAKWLGNDRIYLSVAEDNNVTALPLPVAVNYGSLVALEFEDSYREWKLVSKVPSDSGDWRTYNGESKLKITNREVHSELEIKVSTSCEFGGTIFPSVNEKGGAGIQPVDVRNYLDVIRRNFLAINDPLFPNDWLNINNGKIRDGEALLEKALKALVARPAFSLNVCQHSDTKYVATSLAERLLAFK